MKLIKYKHIVLFDIIEETSGFKFEVNNRQFGMRKYEKRIYITDLYTGHSVLIFKENDLLNLSNEQQIDFASYYISKITPEQWTNAEERVKINFPQYKFPINDKL